MNEPTGTANAAPASPAPFQVTTTGEFAAIIRALGKTLAIASYNSGLLLLASAVRRRDHRRVAIAEPWNHYPRRSPLWRLRLP